MEVDVLLQQSEVEATQGLHIIGVVFTHEIERALYDSADASCAHEHVVGLFLQHEVAGPR